MISKFRGFIDNVPLRLVTMVLVAILVPSVLVTGLGLLAVFQADRFVHERVTGPFRLELETLRGRLEREWKGVLEEYLVRLEDAPDRVDFLGTLRKERVVRDVLISDSGGLRRAPMPTPYRELWLVVEPEEFRWARALEAKEEYQAALAAYGAILGGSQDDALRLESLLGAARVSHELGHWDRARAYLREALRRYGDTVDASGVIRKLPILLRILEIERRADRPEAQSTARELAGALAREDKRIDPVTSRFYRGRLERLASQEVWKRAEEVSEASDSAGARDRGGVLVEQVRAALDVPVPAESRGRPVVRALTIGGSDEVVASFPPRGNEFEVHLVLDQDALLADIDLFCEELGIERSDVLTARPGGSVLGGRPGSGANGEVVAVAPLPPPLAHLELRYAPSRDRLPAGFRSFDVITLATFSWAVFVLVLTIVVGVLFTLRSVLREMRTARLKSDFVSFISHELKTPLASIRMFTETLLDGRIKNEDERAQCLEMIDQESRRLSVLIDKVLEYSKIEKHQKVFRFTSCDMESVVREAVNLFNSRMQEHPREIEINSVQRISKIRMDRSSMVELILNLISNASKYSDAASKITINLRESIDEITVDVVDQGVGIPKRDQKKVFDKFFRADDYLTREIEGMGLGLAFARYIAKVHNGDIKVASQVNSGSTFTLHLRKTHVLAE